MGKDVEEELIPYLMILKPLLQKISIQIPRMILHIRLPHRPEETDDIRIVAPLLMVSARVERSTEPVHPPSRSSPSESPARAEPAATGRRPSSTSRTSTRPARGRRRRRRRRPGRSRPRADAGRRDRGRRASRRGGSCFCRTSGPGDERDGAAAERGTGEGRV